MRSAQRTWHVTVGSAFRAAVVALFTLAAAPAHAKDLLDWVIEAVDPTLAPARPLIECLAGGGNAIDCAAETANKQATQTLGIGPGDDRIKKLVAVFEAARDEQWLKVVNIGGQVAAKTIICAVIPVQGPVKGPVCDIVGWVISTKAQQLDDAYQALKGPDWWALIGVVGTGACQFIPGDGAAGAAKDVLCSALAEVLLAAQKAAEQVAKGFVAGADALENAIFGDDSHMPYNTYYALYWQPWYQYATALAFEGQSIGPISSKIWHPCVDYFDAHNQYRSTARKTCSDMRDKRFSPEVQAFAKALPVAVDGYFESVARPAIRGAVLNSYGKPSSGELPLQKLFVNVNCPFQMRARFPFPEPDDGRCKLLQDQGKKFELFKSLFNQLATQCFADLKLQDVQPTVWARACDAMTSQYQQAFASESLKFIGQIGKLKSRGCVGPGQEEAKKSGLRLICDNYAGYSACLEALQSNGKKYCRQYVPLVQASSQGGGNAAVSGTPQLVPGAVNAGADSTTAARQAEPRNRRASASTIAAVGRVLQSQSGPIDAEAEALFAAGKVQLRGGRTVSQPMAGFGQGWSADAQLFWLDGAAGATLDFLIEVPRAASYEVEVFLTRAPDYGQLQMEVDGQRSRAGFDGYAPGVMPPVAIALGSYALEPGTRRVSLMIVGKNPSSTGFLVGVDRLRLAPAAAR